MFRCCLVEFVPPFMICLFSKVAAHRFHNVSRIAQHMNAARLCQLLQADGRRGYFSLLICSVAEILADSLPITLEAKYSDSCGTRFSAAVSQARAVTNDGY